MFKTKRAGTFKFFTEHRRLGIIIGTYWKQDFPISPLSLFMLMLNPWAVVSLLSWSGGNRGGWGIAGWKMFENVWFQTILAQCLGHLEITWDEYLEWLHHWKLQVGSMLPFGLGVASQRGRNIWWSKQAQICALKMLLFGTVELLERPEHESLKWTKQKLSRAEIYLSRNMYAQRPSPTRLHPPTGALPGNSMAFYGFWCFFCQFRYQVVSEW